MFKTKRFTHRVVCRRCTVQSSLIPFVMRSSLDSPSSNNYMGELTSFPEATHTTPPPSYYLMHEAQ